MTTILYATYLWPIEDIYHGLDILPLKNLVINTIAVEIFKHHKGIVSKALAGPFRLNHSNRSNKTQNKGIICSAYQ